MAVPQNESVGLSGQGPLRVYVDVTDAVRTAWAGGIQRVVRQLARHLLADDRVDLVPMVWSRQLAAFRRLTAEELARLAEQPTVGAAPEPSASGRLGPVLERVRPVAGTVRRALGRVRRGLAELLERAGLKAPLAELLRRVGVATVHRDLRSEALGPMPTGSVLFELDAVWNVVGLDRGALHAELRSRGVRVAVLVYDLLTQEHPEWFEGPVVALSSKVLEDQASHADVVMTISQHTADSFLRWAKEHDLTPPDPLVVTLGADVEGSTEGGPGGPRSAQGPGAALPVELEGRSYLLVVGTVEPRKNHATLLDAHERLAERHPDVDLVVVGRAGWCNDSLIDRLRRLSAPGSGVHWFEGVDDALLSTLYRNAFLVTVPSITEGYGLPVIEALGHGVPVVSSNGGALPEAGGDHVEYADPDDAAAWAAVIARHLDDPEHHRRMRERAVGFRPPTWQQTADAVIRALGAR